MRLAQLCCFGVCEPPGCPTAHFHKDKGIQRLDPLLLEVSKAGEPAPNHLNEGYSAKRVNGTKLPSDTIFGRKTAQIQGLLAKKSKPVRKRWLSVVLETSYSQRQALGGVII